MCAKYWKFAFTRTRKHRNTPGTNRQKTWQLARVTDVILASEQALQFGDIVKSRRARGDATAARSRVLAQTGELLAG